MFHFIHHLLLLNIIISDLILITSTFYISFKIYHKKLFISKFVKLINLIILI